MTFKDKTVLITGGGSGMGLEAAKKFVEHGANVVINGRNAGKLEKAANQIDSTGKSVAVYAGDIARPDTAQGLAAKAEERFGGVDILFNNAGVFAPKPFLDSTENDFDYYASIILKGSFFAAQAAAKAMQKRGGGAIVQTGSMWALQALGATPSAAYSVAKAGVHQLTKNLAIELAGDNIRINTIAPAVVETPVFSTFMSEEQVRETLPQFAAIHPLGRNGTTSDIINAVLFLASSDAAWITGTILPVDGGVMAGRN